jgi:hypothetical protein
MHRRSSVADGTVRRDERDSYLTEPHDSGTITFDDVDLIDGTHTAWWPRASNTLGGVLTA